MPQGPGSADFPCNDFGAQEPGSLDEIKSFCSTTQRLRTVRKVHAKGDTPSPTRPSTRWIMVMWVNPRFWWANGAVIARFRAASPKISSLRLRRLSRPNHLTINSHKASFFALIAPVLTVPALIYDLSQLNNRPKYFTGFPSAISTLYP